MILPATPSRASISRRIVPFPIPPKLGLQEHVPMLSNFGVMSAVFAPDRAAAAQASAPAWPPPITTTSYGLRKDINEKKVSTINPKHVNSRGGRSCFQHKRENYEPAASCSSQPSKAYQRRSPHRANTCCKKGQMHEKQYELQKAEEEEKVH